jgi:hypothetical protein
VDFTPFVSMVTAILGGGLVWALIAYRKVGPEIESISVEAMSTVIKDLRTEMENREKDCARRIELVRVECRQEIDTLKARLHAVESS